MSATIGVITFPGTLDDVDALRAVRLAGAQSRQLWHADDDLTGVAGHGSRAVGLAGRGHAGLHEGVCGVRAGRPPGTGAGGR